MPNTRKNLSRKNRKDRKEEMAPPAMRKQEGGKRKGTKKAKRALSPALKAWNEKVMKKYREMKAKNPNVKLRDAMKAAKRDS